MHVHVFISRQVSISLQRDPNRENTLSKLMTLHAHSHSRNNKILHAEEMNPLHRLVAVRYGCISTQFMCSIKLLYEYEEVANSNSTMYTVHLNRMVCLALYIYSYKKVNNCVQPNIAGNQ